MPGLVPGIHVFISHQAWMAGTSPAMTNTNPVIPAVRPTAGTFFYDESFG
jgi:hypothetical protein